MQKIKYFSISFLDSRGQILSYKPKTMGVVYVNWCPRDRPRGVRELNKTNTLIWWANIYGFGSNSHRTHLWCPRPLSWLNLCPRSKLRGSSFFFNLKNEKFIIDKIYLMYSWYFAWVHILWPSPLPLPNLWP